MKFDTTALREIGRAATAGPWERYGFIGQAGLTKVRSCGDKDRVGRTVYREVPSTSEDASFIATARNHWDAMLDEIERLRKILAHVPGRIAIEAKEAAGFGDTIHAKEPPDAKD